MCIDPATIAIAASVASAAVGTAGTVMQAQAQAAAAAQVAANERALAEDALKRGEQEKEAQRRKTSALEGRQKAVMAASGLDVESGSPLEILGDTAMLGEYDVQVIGQNAWREAWTHRQNARLAEMEKSAAQTAGVVGGFASALSGIGGVMDTWYNLNPVDANDPWAGVRTA